MGSFKKITAIFLAFILTLSSSLLFVNANADPKLNYRNDFNWGVCIHTPEINGTTYHVNNIDWQLKMAAEMGVKMIRTGVSNRLYHTDRTVKMANDYGLKVMLVISIPNKTYDINQSVDLQNIKNVYQKYATRYNGKNGFGKVDYIQIDNEMDNELMGRFGVETNGDKISNYNLSDLKAITAQVKAATEGIKAANSGIKSVINFSWKHYGMLDYFYQNGVDWDIIGHDWYSDMMYAEEANGKTAYEIGDTLHEKFGKEIILCETNVFGKDFSFSDEDASNWDVLVRAMQDYYNRDFVIGAVFYELCDQIGRQGEDYYEKEAHFGLIYSDRNGKLISLKPIYYRLQNIIGPGDVQKSQYCMPEPTSENTIIEIKSGILSGMNLVANSNSYYYDKGLAMFSAMDTRGAEYIEVDIYSSHDTDSSPTLALSNGGDNPKSKSGFKIPYLKAGWNHIVIDYNNAYDGHTLDKSKVDTIFFGGVFSKDQEVSITVANLAFTVTTPNFTYKGTLYSKFGGVSSTVINANEDILEKSVISLPTPANLDVTGYISTNVYVSADCTVTLNLNSTPKRVAKPSEIASAKKQISLKKGWNEIIFRTTEPLKSESWSKNQRFNSQSISFVYFSGVLSEESQLSFSMGDLFFTVVSADEKIEKGDYNADFSVNMLDAVFVKNQLLSDNPWWYPNVAEFSGADNGYIDSLDLIRIKNLLFGCF